ncbi:unnamed protein product, partial [Dicrocoelium dendriticum]
LIFTPSTKPQFSFPILIHAYNYIHEGWDRFVNYFRGKPRNDDTEKEEYPTTSTTPPTTTTTIADIEGTNGSDTTSEDAYSGKLT